LHDIVGQKFFIVIEFEISKAEEKSWLFINSILTIVSPVIFFKVNFFDSLVRVESHSVEFLILDEKMQVLLDDWIQVSISHDLWDNFVIEVLIQKLPLEQLFLWQEV
jgi:hypothetical protein